MRGHPDRRAFGVGQRRPGNVDAPSTSRSPRPMRYDLPELGFHSLSLCLAPELEVGTVLPGRGEKYISGETLIGFVCAHGDAFEFVELAEEVFDLVAPLGDFRSRDAKAALVGEV